MLQDTIAAISTPLGEGGLAVIRLSGPQAVSVADQCFKGKVPLASVASHTLHYGHIVHHGQPIDEVMAAVMRAPRTFTREDVVEISCHGGILTTKQVLDVLLAAGARLALPGEFTKRAFLNGRIDLTQAEAVIDLIHARTALSVAAAQDQLAGKLSAKIGLLRDDLMHALAHIEAHIDFPEEDIAPDTRMTLIQKLSQSIQFITKLLCTAHEGQILRRGIRVAIIGRPNTGKSSLLNELLGRDRAIVSPIPGTTRDTIEETADIRGLPFNFIDTAGLRHSSDPIEREGIRRSHESIDKAEVIILLLDGSEPMTAEDAEQIKRYTDRPCLVVVNKADLPVRLELPADVANSCIRISCTTGIGIESLKDQLKAMVWSGDVDADMAQVMINSRHQNALLRAQKAVESTISGLRDNMSLELTAMDLRIAVNAVGEIVGKTATDDLLESIFSQFCIGK